MKPAPTVTIPALGYAVAVLIAAVFWSLLGASCMHLKAAWKRQEIRRIEQDWATHKPHQPWIYAPLVLLSFLLLSCSKIPAPDTAHGHTPTCLEGHPPLTHTLP
jgi:hypothetical protein